MVMAPKSQPPLAKQNMILQYIQNSCTTHTIKELEKVLPSVASINGMQVKDYLQALSDEGKIRVEKIGSGNWYWSFLSEEKKSRDTSLAALKIEKEKTASTIRELEAKMEMANEQRSGDDDGRAEMTERTALLEADIIQLKRELEGYKDADPVEIETRKQETASFKSQAEVWTDNIMILEARIKDMLCGDNEALDALKRQVYGSEYVEDQGLREL